MIIEEFNKKYKDKGGIAKLNEFRSLLFSLNHIADHFGVSKERAKQWIVNLYGENYDPRKERREKIVGGMIEFAKNNKKENFDEAFYFANEEYKLQALSECYQRKIYDIK